MKKILLLISFTALIALSSCGGGGGNGDSSSSSTSTSAFPSDVTTDMPY